MRKVSKQKISPGMMLDFVTPEELASHLDNQGTTILKALGKNAQFKRVVEATQSDANGNFVFPVGPADGFLWDVRAVAAVYGPSQDTVAIGMYFNNNNSLNFVDSILEGDAISKHSYSKTVIVHSNDNLVFAPLPTKNPSANSYVTVQLYVIEVPNSHEAQLLL